MTPVCGLLLLLGAAAAMPGGVRAAEAPVSANAAPLPRAAMPYASDDGDVLLLACRRGWREARREMQEMPQDLPLLCLAAPADEQVPRAAPAQSDEPLRSAALVRMDVMQRP